MSTTIHFNTGRRYTKAGQRITATMNNERQRLVTFYDRDRMIHGGFDLGADESFDQRTVMSYYDSGSYNATLESMQDAMSEGGCNSKYEGK